MSMQGEPFHLQHQHQHQHHPSSSTSSTSHHSTPIYHNYNHLPINNQHQQHQQHQQQQHYPYHSQSHPLDDPHHHHHSMSQQNHSQHQYDPNNLHRSNAGLYDARQQNQHHQFMNGNLHPQQQHQHQPPPPIPTLPTNQSFFYPNNPNHLHHPHQPHPQPQHQPHPSGMNQQPMPFSLQPTLQNKHKKRSGPSDPSNAPERKKSKPASSSSSSSNLAKPDTSISPIDQNDQNTVTVFQCAGYGDCKMTFTRSEHLARHIRKHTGERPFQCHCGKAFSRLDNLRQHANTVHVDSPDLNEKSINALTALHAQLAAAAAQQQHAHTQTLPRAAADALVQASAEQNGRKKKTPGAKKAAGSKEKKGGSSSTETKPRIGASAGDSSNLRRTSSHQHSTPVSHPEEPYPYPNEMGGQEDPYASPYPSHASSTWQAPPGGDSFYSTPREHGSGSGSGSGSGGVNSFRNSYDSNGGPSYFHPSDSHPQNQGPGPGSYYAYDHHQSHHQNIPAHHPHPPHDSHFGQTSPYEDHHSSHHPHQAPDQYSPGYDQYSNTASEEPQSQSHSHHQFNQSHPIQQTLNSRYSIPNDGNREDQMEFSESYYPQAQAQGSHYATPGSGSGSSPSGSFSAGPPPPQLTSSSFQSTLSAHLHMRTPTMSRQSFLPKESPPPSSSIVTSTSPELPIVGHDRPILPPLASLSRPGTAGGVTTSNASNGFSLLNAGGNEDRRPSIGLGSLGHGAIGRGSIDAGRGSIDYSNSNQGAGPSLPSIEAHLSASEGSTGDKNRPFTSPASRTNGPGLAPISGDSTSSSNQDPSNSSLPESLRSSSIGGNGSNPNGRGLIGSMMGDSPTSRPNTTGGSKPGASILASMAAAVNERLSRPTSSSHLTSLASFGGNSGNEEMKAPNTASSKNRSFNNQNNENLSSSDVKTSESSNSSPFMFQPPPLPGMNNPPNSSTNTGGNGVAWNTASPFGGSGNKPSSSKLNGVGLLTKRRGSEDLGRTSTDGKEKTVSLPFRPGSSSGTETSNKDDEGSEIRSRPFTSGDSTSDPKKFNGKKNYGNLGIKTEDEDEDDDFFPPPPSGAGLDSRRVSIASLMNDDREGSSSNHFFGSGGGNGSSRLSFGGGDIFSSKWWSFSNGNSSFSRPGSRPGTSSYRDSFSLFNSKDRKSLDYQEKNDEMDKKLQGFEDEEKSDKNSSRRNSSAPPTSIIGEKEIDGDGDGFELNGSFKSASVPLLEGNENSNIGNVEVKEEN